ncbi:hypothetical protein COK37_21065 [Bacillus thuringiensis]|uniref:HNH endonuclease n=1 Tax=Bacillus thuringiensis TaxID=1428 RepID=UPI000BF57195|nr:HNH endonuclease [Bacillus thuringiensis]PEV50742.1 hypothetical protein CN432_09040 [Bacillus thuringiensis]PFR65841.1 hypothetical protein COK37_21065 [Bacillus thuringiensis]PFT77440.1 hypothetical protein COK70_19840 [Bacillus thuringiensis]PFV87914.1 hypothetical protein COL06_15080 [Bacillus thuringiensis]
MINIDYFKQTNGLQIINEKAEIIEKAEIVVTKESLFTTTDSIKLPEQNVMREPLGSIRPRLITNSNEFNTRNSKQTSVKIGNYNPKKTREITTTIRDQILVSQFKELYNHTCQVCREKIETGLNQFATEVHHIKPLGLHNGPHIKENMIILCPNHHVMFDKGAITIDLSKKTVMHINPKNLLII